MAFYANEESTGRRVILLHINIDDNKAYSPRSAPYGPVEFDSIEEEVASAFFAFVISELSRRGVKEILIKDTPSVFRPRASAQLNKILAKHAFTATADVASTIVISADASGLRMSDAKRKRIKKATTAGLVVRQLQPDRLADVYQFIAECRAKKNYQMSMTLEQLNATVLKFPDHFFLFGVFDSQQLVAACVAVLVSDETLYTFYASHHPDYDRLNPSVLQVSEIYTFAQQRGLRYLDLGTSSADGRQSPTILDFKRELGATQSPVYTYHKLLA